ncbi:MAG: MFS transporter [Planctomycetota bacterium]|nr:MAG: MFS transporter [Planctomycetota bacterium]
MYCASLAAWQPWLAVYFKKVGISGLQIGIIMSIAPIMVFLVQPMWGVVADRWGHHRTLLFTMFLASFAILGYVWNGGFWFFFFWAVVVSFVTNPIGTLMDSIILDYVKRKQDSSYGRFRMWGTIGLTVCSLVCSVIVGCGISWLFTRRFVTFMSLYSMWIIFFIILDIMFSVRSYGRFRMWGAIGWAVASPVVGWIITGRNIILIFPISMAVMLLGWLAGFLRRDKTRAVLATSEASWQNLSGVLRNWRLIVFLVIAFFYGVGTSPVWTFYGVYLDDIGASHGLKGFAFGLDAAIEFPFYFFSIVFVKHFGARRVLTFSILMFAIRLFLYSVISTPVLAASVELMHGLTFSLFIVSAVEYVNELVPPAWRATGQSLYAAACFGAGTLAGNTFAGYLYDQMPLQQVYRFTGWLLLIVAVVAAFALRSRSKKNDSQVTGAE